MKNEYTARKVALKDMQACLICHKPTTTVLHNGPDWFYTCDIHLQDNPQFVTALYSTEYKEAVAKLKSIKPPAEAVSVGWDGWVSKLLKKDGSKDKEGKEKTPEDQAQVQKQYNEQLDLVARLQKQNRGYQLNPIMFDSRIQRKQAEARAKEQKRLNDESYTNTDPQELIEKFAFPSVPKT